MKSLGRYSIYKSLGEKLKREAKRNQSGQDIHVGNIIRGRRLEKNLRGVDLCRRAGDLDPKTLTAIEKGRIKNPSVKTLQSVARGLSVTVSDLFKQAELQVDRNLYLGSQKGFYQVAFPSMGLKAVCFTPLIQEFFCGKFMLAPKKGFRETLLKHPFPIFASSLVGRFEVEIEGRKLSLHEGENLFFNGILKHSFYNPLQREAVLLMMTAPSFFK